MKETKRSFIISVTKSDC